MARGLTLEVLGHLASLLGARDDVQYRVLERLDSSHHLETAAALYAAQRVMPLSEPFTQALVKRAPQLLQGAHTSTSLQVRLLAVLGSCGAHAAPAARAILQSELERSLGEAHTTQTLASLTRLALLGGASHIDAHAQCLMRTAHVDGRPRVQLAAAQGLALLVRRAPQRMLPHSSTILALVAAHAGAESVRESVLAALVAVVAFLARHWPTARAEYDTEPLASLLAAPSPRVRLWTLRALGCAALAFPRAAEQLGAYCCAQVTRADASLLGSSGVLRACLMLMGSDAWAPRVFEALVARSASMPQLLPCLAVAARSYATHLRLRGAMVAPELVVQLSARADAAIVLGEHGHSAFAAALVCLIRVGAVASVLGDLIGRAARAHCDAHPPWRWALYRVARQASTRLGLHDATAAVWQQLVPYVSWEAHQKWLLALLALSRSEAARSAGHWSDACMHSRRALVLLAACSGQYMTATSATAGGVSSVHRALPFRFQRLWIEWRIGVLECAPERLPLLRELADVAAMREFVDVDDSTALYAAHAQWCLSALASGSPTDDACVPLPNGKPTVAVTPLSTHYLPALRAALVEPLSAAQRADLLHGFRAATAALPPYFFTPVPRVHVEVTIVKPLAVVEGLSSSSTSGFSLVVDGIIRTAGSTSRFRPKSVELTVSVLQSSDKARLVSAEWMCLLFFFAQITASSSCSLICRLLAACPRVPTAAMQHITALSSQLYRTPLISGESFRVPVLVSLPDQPRSQYVVQLSVTVVDARHVPHPMAVVCVEGDSLVPK